MNFTHALKTETSRRTFLIGVSALAGGLAVGYSTRAIGSNASESAMSPFDAYVQIDADNTVTVLSSQFDMGQGSYHGLATLVIEELGASWDQISVIGAAGNTALYGNPQWGGAVQGTGGSTSIAGSFDRYRQAGAVAREMLVSAAASEWNVPAKEISVSDGMLTHSSGKSATFGAFAAAAATQPVPSDVKLKDASEWQQIGSEDLRRYDSAPKTDGTHMFTGDIDIPGLLTAVMIHPPKFGATLTSFEATEAKQMPGVVDVVSTPRGVAVVAEHMWAALSARDLVTVTWDETNAETRGSEDLFAEYKELSNQAPKAMARLDGDPDGAMAGAAKVVEATYEFPYLAHASMEPLNAIARMNDDGTLEVWGAHQLPDLDGFAASQIAEIEPSKVRVHVQKAGGSFGRRATPDSDITAEAVMVAKAIGFKAPVKVQWTRENDMRGGRYRPLYVHKMRAGLDENGNIVAWDHHIVGQSIVAGTPFEGLIQNGVDKTSVEGASNMPYSVPNIRVGLTSTEVGIPVLWWRAVGSTHTAHAVETFLDEIAVAAGKDPVELRMALLDGHDRHKGALKLAVEQSGYGNPLPEGRFHGVSLHESFASYVAQIAEISIEDGMPKVHKITCAVDCGIVVNPDTVRAQMEGGIGFGLGAAMTEELVIEGGEVVDGNYDSYLPLRIEDMPEIDVHIVQSSESPTGVGEPGTPPVAAAVANALMAATGKKTHKLPFSAAS